MNSKIAKLITAKNWQFYLSRPFTIFGASLWQHWYNSEDALICLGTISPDVLFIEEEKHVARCYRPKDQIDQLNSSVREVIFNKKRAVKLMKEGAVYNSKAAKVLSGKEKFRTIIDALDFLVAMGLRSTVLPNRVGEFLEDKKMPDVEVIKLTKQLRSISYYPRVLEEIIMPMMVKELKNQGVLNPGKISELITYNEFIGGKFNIPKNRYELNRKDSFYLFTEIKHRQDIRVVKDNIDLIRQLEPKLNFSEIKGSAAYWGSTTGIVKLVSVRSIKKIKFKPGQILVSVSTSPIYLSLMKKAAAIVTDEGGLTSHAAILARELKKPTIIGTKVATKILKDGDLVEVDANQGIVKILKKAK